MYFFVNNIKEKNHLFAVDSFTSSKYMFINAGFIESGLLHLEKCV